MVKVNELHMEESTNIIRQYEKCKNGVKYGVSML